MKKCIDCGRNNGTYDIKFIGAQCNHCYNNNPIVLQVVDEDVRKISDNIKFKRRKPRLICLCGNAMRKPGKCYHCREKEKKQLLRDQREEEKNKFIKMYNLPESIYCTGCKEYHHVSEFYFDKSKQSTYKHCKKHHSILTSKWKQENSEYHKQYQKEYHKNYQRK